MVFKTGFTVQLIFHSQCGVPLLCNYTCCPALDSLAIRDSRVYSGTSESVRSTLEGSINLSCFVLCREVVLSRGSKCIQMMDRNIWDFRLCPL